MSSRVARTAQCGWLEGSTEGVESHIRNVLQLVAVDGTDVLGYVQLSDY
ncbi:hypothetical protein [Lentzea sp. NPDC055074]